MENSESILNQKLTHEESQWEIRLKCGAQPSFEEIQLNFDRILCSGRWKLNFTWKCKSSGCNFRNRNIRVYVLSEVIGKRGYLAHIKTI